MFTVTIDKAFSSSLIIAAVLIFQPELSVGLFRFNFDLVTDLVNFEDAKQICRTRGYDGLALIATPEEFDYALRISQELRESWGLWVGMQYDEVDGGLTWDDGVEAVPDLPWISGQPNATSSTPCCRIHVEGKLGMLSCGSSRYALCGQLLKKTKQAAGETNRGRRVTGKISTLSQHTVRSFIECAIMCGRDDLCRVAEFDMVQKLCITIGPEQYSGFEAHNDFNTFVRQSF